MTSRLDALKAQHPVIERVLSEAQKGHPLHTDEQAIAALVMLADEIEGLRGMLAARDAQLADADQALIWADEFDELPPEVRAQTRRARARQAERSAKKEGA